MITLVVTTKLVKAAMNGDDQAVREIERQLAALGRRIDQMRYAPAPQSGPGLDKVAYRVLARLIDQGPQRATSIAAHFGLDESTVSRQVESLVAAGLVERERDAADRRAYLLRPTAPGRRYLADARRARRDFLTELLAEWTPEDRATFADLLARFNADLEQRAPRQLAAVR